MGHAPSSECCNHEPFVVDFESKGKGHERLAAIALTKHNIIDMTSPLFRGFFAARCDESVRHWYCSDADRSVIKPAPESKFIFEKFIEEATAYVESAENNDPSEFSPLPIALIKLPQEAILFHENGQLLTTLELLGTNPEFEVVGYFGCRHFGSAGHSLTPGVLGMFLSKTFNNEAKSVAIMEIACRCFKHYMSMYGMVDTPWPKEIQFDTLDSNLPCLRLMQKLLVSSNQVPADDEEFIVTHDVQQQRLKVIAKGSVVSRFAEHLAAQVTTQDSITFALKTRPVEPAPACQVHPKLDEVITHAKKMWASANRPVVEAYTMAKLARLETSSVMSSIAPSTASLPYPSLVAPRPIEAGTPVSTTIASSAGIRGASLVDEAPPMTATTYRHSVYDYQVLAEQDETEHQQLDEESNYNFSVAEQQSTRGGGQEVAPSFSSFQIEQKNDLGLYLAKRTPISYFKKGRWTTAQWRDEAMVRLCEIQNGENDGLFAVELMYPSRNLSCAEISVFDEFNRPAKVRLDRPSIFYVPNNSLYHRDIASKKYIPFSVATAIAIEGQQEYHMDGARNHYSAPQTEETHTNYTSASSNPHPFPQEIRNSAY